MRIIPQLYSVTSKTRDMFITPSLEVKKADEDRFVSLSFDKNHNPTVYKYLDGTNQLKTVNIPAKAFERLTLATLDDGSTIYCDTSGNIITEKTPMGI